MAHNDDAAVANQLAGDCASAPRPVLHAVGGAILIVGVRSVLNWQVDEEDGQADLLLVFRSIHSTLAAGRALMRRGASRRARVRTEPRGALSIEMFNDLPPELRRSLTWDQGSEIAHHHAITEATTTRVFLCDPGKPWQRPSNENTKRPSARLLPEGIRPSSLQRR